MPRPLHKYIALCVVGLISFLVQLKTLNEFPQHIHSWAQCDRYALALGFIDNGGDFFHPQTYVMNNQFPGEFMIPRETTITSVDFPIHDYLVSLVMRVAQTTAPWCFRLYVLLYSIAGLYFLYKLTGLFTPCLTRSLFVVLFALSSPVFLYYQAGFLPTIPSLANAIIGLYYFVYFLKTGRRNYFYLCLFFVSLAALARLPFAILLVAIGCFEAAYVLKNRRLEGYKLLGFVLALGSIAAYYLYNGYLREHYGSLFLNYIIPATSFSDFTDFTKTALKRWGFQYFNSLSYLILAVVALVGTYHSLRNRRHMAVLEKQFLFLIGILLCGCALYYILMCYQFMNHDYYFLDTFYLPLIGLFLFFIVKWPTLSVPRPKLLGALSLLVFVPVFLFSREKLQERIALFSGGESPTADTYQEAGRLLDSLKVPEDARLLVFGNDGSNNAFILLKRKGFVIIEPDSAKIETALKWPYDYIVADDVAMISRVYGQDPTVIDKIRRIGGNGKIGVYVRDKAVPPLTEEQFFGLDRRTPFFDSAQHFEAPVLDIQRQNDAGACWGNYAAVLDSVTEYGFTYSLRDLSVLKQKPSLLKIACRFRSAAPSKDLLLCVSLKSEGRELLFKAFPVKSIPAEWHDGSFLMPLPEVPEKQSELKIFVWNRGKNNVLYDDFQVTIY